MININSKKTEICFKETLWESGFTCLDVKSKKEISIYLCVSYRTLDRWIQNNRPSKAAIRLLENKRKSLNKHWNGFYISENEICTPNGYSYSTHELKSLAIKIQQINALSI